MPRIRSLKPDFFLDEDLGELPLWVRVLYEGLWCQADKSGRLEDRPLKLKAVIFPYDKYDVNDGLNQLSKPKAHSPKHTPFIARYIVEGERYIQILSWELHQNPHHTEKDSCIPKPNVSLTVTEPLDKGSMGDAHYQETSNKKQRTRTKKQETSEDFNRFWDAYPRRVDRKVAAESWDRAIGKGADPSLVVAGAIGYAKVCLAENTPPKYIKHPPTFINKESWKDYLTGGGGLNTGNSEESLAQRAIRETDELRERRRLEAEAQEKRNV